MSQLLLLDVEIFLFFYLIFIGRFIHRNRGQGRAIVRFLPIFV